MIDKLIAMETNSILQAAVASITRNAHAHHAKIIDQSQQVQLLQHQQRQVHPPQPVLQHQPQLLQQQLLQLLNFQPIK